MNRIVLSVAAASLILSGVAHGADLGWNNTSNNTNNFYSPSSAFQWQGFYAGVNAGYGWGTLELDPVVAGPATTEDDMSGWQVGVQAGYNVDMGGFVLGAETDLQWSSIAFNEDLLAGELEAGMHGFGTLRGRAGMTFDRVMPYVTGGLAYGFGNVSVTDPLGVTTSQGQTHMGWTVGGGLEAAATDNITIKAEYLYVDLGTQNYISAPAGTSDATQRFSVIRAGLNYKF